jgi:hypothetical protein
MPNFDGNGPLKCGRLIGRGRGPCTENTPDCAQENSTPEIRHDNETHAQ